MLKLSIVGRVGGDRQHEDVGAGIGRTQVLVGDPGPGTASRSPRPSSAARACSPRQVVARARHLRSGSPTPRRSGPGPRNTPSTFLRLASALSRETAVRAAAGRAVWGDIVAAGDARRCPEPPPPRARDRARRRRRAVRWVKLLLAKARKGCAFSSFLDLHASANGGTGASGQAASAGRPGSATARTDTRGPGEVLEAMDIGEDRARRARRHGLGLPALSTSQASAFAPRNSAWSCSKLLVQPVDHRQAVAAEAAARLPRVELDLQLGRQVLQ